MKDDGDGFCHDGSNDRSEYLAHATTIEWISPIQLLCGHSLDNIES
jgi:hypothetical protein